MWVLKDLNITFTEKDDTFFSQTFCFFMTFARLSYLKIKELHLKCI